MEGLSSNLIALLGGALSVVAGWAWKRARGVRADELADDLAELVAVELDELIAEVAEPAIGEARRRFEAACYELADALRIRRSFVRPLVRQAAERGVVELRRRLVDRRKVAAELRRLGDAASGVTFAAPVSATVPRLELDLVETKHGGG